MLQVHKMHITTHNNHVTSATYRQVHEAQELAQHLHHWTEAEAGQCLTHLLCQLLADHTQSHMNHHVTDVLIFIRLVR